MPRNLASGSAGPDVRNLQQLLNYHLSPPFPPISVDGSFGPQTADRVMLFQDVNSLDSDGIVGPLTRAVLLDARAIGYSADVQPQSPNIAFRAQPAFRLTQAVRFGAGPATAPPTGPPLHRQFQLFAGQQININPWFVQPLVITAQFNWLAKRDGSPDFMLTLGGQASLNQVGGPAGTFSGQGFAQMGLSGLLKPGNFDLLNPFVVAMLQKNQGQPFGLGFGLGNQMNYNLLPNGSVSLFLNSQLVTNIDLSNGQASAPGLQILGGVGFTFDSK